MVFGVHIGARHYGLWGHNFVVKLGIRGSGFGGLEGSELKDLESWGWDSF